GEVGAVLEKIERARGERWVGVESLQSDGIRGEPLEKMLEGAIAAAQLGAIERCREAGCALFQGADHIARLASASLRRCFDRGCARVHHALINLDHLFKMPA